MLPTPILVLLLTSPDPTYLKTPLSAASDALIHRVLATAQISIFGKEFGPWNSGSNACESSYYSCTATGPGNRLVSMQGGPGFQKS